MSFLYFSSSVFPNKIEYIFSTLGKVVAPTTFLILPNCFYNILMGK